MPLQRFGIVHCASEWEFISAKQYADPFAEVELDVVFTDPVGTKLCVPAYWAGGNEWRVRFAPQLAGLYAFQTICSDTTDAGLHHLTGSLEVAPYDGSNVLLQHGPPKVGSNGRSFEYADGTPFFWLGDTWWMSLCKRMSWPDDFQLLTADRVAKGFTVVQLVAGLYPDMPPFDPRGANEAGYPWTENFETLNPAYFDMTDLRIQWLVKEGIVPCIVGFWGYFLPLMGYAKIKQHWRNLIARYGAYPVVWCLAGEGIMPYYFSTNRESDIALQKRGLTELARYVRSIDPYHHPITVHPTNNSRSQVDDSTVVDFEMLQTGHEGYASLPNTLHSIQTAVVRKPLMPALVDEVDYEGIMESSREEVQRICFWTSMLAGAAGHTYGANGLWQVNTRDQPFGPSPHGASWGDIPWQDAYRLPGSTQLGIAKRLLERFEWHRFEPHQDWVEPRADAKNVLAPYCAGIPGQVRIYYFPTPIAPWTQLQLAAKVEQTINYVAFFFDPKTGNEHRIGRVLPLMDGTWRVPLPPIIQDWVLVLERVA